ncbi:MAG: radical SAM protein, partial [Chloroflexota bacterium]
MAKVTLSSQEQSEQLQISPDYVRISMAAAIELGLKAGRMFRDTHCGCINLLQNYPEGCYANCTY